MLTTCGVRRSDDAFDVGALGNSCVVDLFKLDFVAAFPPLMRPELLFRWPGIGCEFLAVLLDASGGRSLRFDKGELSN